MIKKIHPKSRIMELKADSIFAEKLLNPISLINEYIILQIEVVDHAKYIAEVIEKKKYEKEETRKILYAEGEVVGEY